jgi:hypothetical protein
MGLEDFFEQDHKRKRYGYGHDYKGHDNHHSSHSYDKHSNIQQQYLEKIMNNPALKKLLITVVVVVLLLAIALIILFFPLINKLISFITQNGVQGIIDTLWNGTK